MIAANLEQDTIVFGKQLESVTPSSGQDNDGPVICTFADGTLSAHDLVVGADGIHSRVRASVFDAAPRQFTKYRIMTLLKEQALGSQSQRLQVEPADSLSVVLSPGASSYLVSTTMKGADGSLTDQAGVVFQTDEEATDAWDNVAAKEQMKEKLAPFVGETRHYLYDLLESADICWDWGIYQHTPMASWTALEGRVVLIGDACHATAPFLGQGANMAIQDAVCLGRFLAELPVQEATKAYEARRKVSCEAIVAGSTRQADMWINAANGPHHRSRSRVREEPLV
jgi:salicylate hydroxylase